MTRSENLAKRLEEILLNGTWIANTNYQNLLENITWQQATTKIQNLNSIALLTFHINYYLSGIIKVLQGGPLEIKDQFSFNAPSISSEKDWLNLKISLLNNSQEFIQLVNQLDDKTLDEVFIDPKYGTYQRNLEGVIEHCYYHLGQISLLKKLIESSGKLI